MAKLMFISFVLATFCFISIYCDATDDAKAFFYIKRNAVFQFRFAKIEIEQVIYKKVQESMANPKSEEQKPCIDEVKVKNIAKSGKILESTVGKILPAIDEVNVALSKGDTSKLVEFNGKWDYKQFKKEAMEQFIKEARDLGNSVQSELDKCLA